MLTSAAASAACCPASPRCAYSVSATPQHPCPCTPGAFYLRLVGRALDVYTYLEPLYNDFRKVGTPQPGAWWMQ